MPCRGWRAKASGSQDLIPFRRSGERPIAAFRFIHTADIHLDSPLKSLALRDPALAELVGDATRHAFTRIVDLCLEEQVDALLIAGDLYDGDQTSMKTARFIGAAFKRLTDAGVRVFLIRGNHDNLSRITREMTLPDGVKLFGGRAGVETIERSGGRTIAVHGLSFSEAEAPDSLLPKYRPPAADALNIGLMHTSLGGSPGHSTYAPVSLAALQASGFRYWALGHIHKRSVAEGATTVVMPGMPQGRDINEAGRKSVTLVTVADDGSFDLEERPVGSAVFVRAEVDLAGVGEWSVLARRIAQSAVSAAAAAAGGRSIVRLSLRGATPLAWRIRRDLELLKAEIEREAGAGEGLLIEKLETSCGVGAPDAPEVGPLAELERIMAEQVLPSDGFRHAAAELGEALVRQLPHELRGLLGDDDAATAQAVALLAEEGGVDILARLRADQPGDAG